MAIKVEMLRYFVEVAKAGNLAQAAETLNRSPSAVSMMLKQLEDNLGGALFEAGNKSRLTPLGEFSYAQSLREVEHFERTVLTLQRYASSQEGVVRVASVPSVATTIVPQAVRDLHARRPGIRVEVSDSATLAVLEMVQNGSFDIGLISAAGHHPTADLKAQTIQTDQFGILCPSDHALVQSSDDVTWADLNRFEFIDNELSSMIDAPALKVACARSRLFVHNVSSLIAFVQMGMGLTVLPALACEKIGSDLAFLIPAHEPSFRRITLVTEPRSELSPAARIFAELLVNAADAA